MVAYQTVVDLVARLLGRHAVRLGTVQSVSGG
jgi:hypothetical protein